MNPDSCELCRNMDPDSEPTIISLHKITGKKIPKNVIHIFSVLDVTKLIFAGFLNFFYKLCYCRKGILYLMLKHLEELLYCPKKFSGGE